ncbi:hypothetical protein OSB04_023898 [Centaurea solstitialis]|uniref:CCHC-type domain-containing protein n=1 Tax=Centaurea solstitialis TaxID=347529 RepID=A0AA38WDD1_9ASTR|nr:hypothetical protein OSB04_023898 [Centaurea solstitialis]
MIQFLNNIDKTLMVSIREGPIKPYIDIPGTPETTTTPAIEPRQVFKLFRHYNELEKIRAELDDKALTFLTMAIPNDLFNRVDSSDTAKGLWDELEKQFQGTERSIQAKLNQGVGAYEGFKALEGETLADSYNWFNIILNDLRRNGMHKSTSEINFKFLKNLNPEWDHYSKSIADSLALLTEKKKSVLPSTSSKKKIHSKAFVTELSDSDSETIEDETSESDVDLKRVADKLALLSSSIHKRYGKKKLYSKPKFENYKKDKYKPKEYEKRPERKSYDKGKTDDKGNLCLNCGKPGHFVCDNRHILAFRELVDLESGICTLSIVQNAKLLKSTDPYERPSRNPSEPARSGSSARRPRTIIEEGDSLSDSDATSHPVPSRSVSPPVYGPATRTELRVRTTARKSVPMPTRMTFRIPTGDGAGPSQVRGQGGSSSSSSSTSSSPPPYRPSAVLPRPPPVAPVPRPPPVVRAPVMCLRGMTPAERQEVARLARGQDIHEHMIDHHNHMIDSLINVAGADSQQLTRVVALLSHTMASLSHLYTIVCMMIALAMILIAWTVWGARF